MRFSNNLLGIKSCKSDKDEDLSGYFESVTRSLNVHNVFNPSFYSDDDVKIFAFRAISGKGNRLTSFVSIEDNSRHLVERISVDSYENLNAKRFIDPKVTNINGEYYITFNSGWNPEGNDIYVMKVYPEMGSPKRIVYRSRQKQERNWALFSKQGEIYALYWINPLKILIVKNKGVGSWEMENFYCGKKQDNTKDLTIGTQLFFFNDQYYFIAHRKRYFRKRKIYLGRFCAFDFGKKTITPGKYWLVHSLISLLGSRVKHNTNLFSCTYFSGLQIASKSIKLGYGINDVGFGFSSHDFGDL